MQKYEAVATMTDGEVIGRISDRAEGTVTGVDFWYQELQRRQLGRSGDRAERLTRYAVLAHWRKLGRCLIAAVAAVLALANTNPVQIPELPAGPS